MWTAKLCHAQFFLLLFWISKLAFLLRNKAVNQQQNTQEHKSSPTTKLSKQPLHKERTKPIACAKLRGEENHIRNYKTKYQRKDKREMVVKKSKK